MPLPWDSAPIWARLAFDKYFAQCPLIAQVHIDGFTRIDNEITVLFTIDRGHEIHQKFRFEDYRFNCVKDGPVVLW